MLRWILGLHVVVAMDPITIASVTAAVGAGVAWLRRPSCGFDSGFKNKFDSYMDASVFGQHIAARAIPPEMRAHLEGFGSRGRSRALALSFHGGTGTGKTYVSRFTEKALFFGEPHKYTFSGASFADPAEVQNYRRSIASIIQKKLMECPYALFVFLDSHLMAPGTLDVLLSYLDYGTEDMNGIDYSKAIYLFQSNACDKEINLMFTEHSATGKMRTELDVDVMEQALKQCLQHSPYGETVLFQKDLVVHVPFLPLTREEVLQCATSLLLALRAQGIEAKKWQGLYWSPQVLHWLVEKLTFVGEYSLTGCKSLEAQVNRHVAYSIHKINPEDRICDPSELRVWERVRPDRHKCHRYGNRTLDVSIREEHVCVTLSAPHTALPEPCLNVV